MRRPSLRLDSPSRYNHIAIIASVVVVMLLSTNVARVSADIVSSAGSYDSQRVTINIVLDSSTSLSAGWDVQLFLDTDRNQSTGYAGGYDVIVRAVDDTNSAIADVQTTLGAGGAGGWGMMLASATVQQPTAQQVTISFSFVEAGLVARSYRYKIETYFSDSLDDVLGNQTTGSGGPVDCNSNGVSDPQDIESGTSLDCNQNGNPDECDVADGLSSDANANGVPDECESFQCVNHVDCDDGNPCTDDACLSGACQFAGNNLACDDDDSCTINDICTGGQCAGTLSTACQNPTCTNDIDCDDGNACTTDFCDSSKCYFTVNSVSCDDGDNCTENDICSNGVCQGIAIPSCATPECIANIDCDDVNTCTTNVCASGVCVFAHFPGLCDDADDCTINDACISGVCVGSPNPTCQTAPPEIVDEVVEKNSPSDDCPSDPSKDEPGQCGCGIEDFDFDGDGVADCVDACPEDEFKLLPGACGFHNEDYDSDGDGVADCVDKCPMDSHKKEPELCGCGNADLDEDHDGVVDCIDRCLRTAMGDPVNEQGCNADIEEFQPVAVEEESPLPQSRGFCGAFGLVSWSATLLGLFGLGRKAKRFTLYAERVS